MCRVPPRSTRTDPLFPSTTLFRSAVSAGAVRTLRAGARRSFPGGANCAGGGVRGACELAAGAQCHRGSGGIDHLGDADLGGVAAGHTTRSEEHTSELQSLMRISYAVLCLKKKKRF